MHGLDKSVKHNTLPKQFVTALLTSNNQRLANVGEDFFFAYLVNKRFGGP